MNVSVVGLGKVGLPLAVQIASKGIATVGVDMDPLVVENVNRGVAPFRETDLPVRLRKVVQSGHLRAVTEAGQAVRDSDVIVLIVPLVVDGRNLPDFSSLDAATVSVGAALRRGPW